MRWRNTVRAKPAVLWWVQWDASGRVIRRLYREAEQLAPEPVELPARIGRGVEVERDLFGGPA
jgi:hypothetical protein